jgi:phosphoribosylaminoimidazole carboxylase (NCAIR synthetase)
MREVSIGIVQDNSNNIIISDLGEFISNDNIFSYEEKYNFNKVNIPNDIDITTVNKIKNISKKLYKLLNLNSYSRIDFFLTKDNEIYFNEINTLPGFTNKSLFTIMFKNKFSYLELLNLIIETAIKS